MATAISPAYGIIAGRSLGAWATLFGLAAAIGLGGIAALYMEHNGHWVTGMTNQVVWGLPHVFAVFLIVAGSGALNVASLASVFGKGDYAPYARLSCLLAMALMAGGLFILLLDLGRADRLMVAMTHYNFTSIFALNIFFYSGFFTLVVLYLWALMDQRMAPLYRPVAFAAFFWRLALTTGTGSIFGFVAARSAYDSALMAPMFIAMSLSFGTACFVLSAALLESSTGHASLPPALVARLRRLLAILTAVSLYMAVVYHMTGLYAAGRVPFERFMLVEGGLHTAMLWVGFVLAGSLLPIALLLSRSEAAGKARLIGAALLIVLGGLSAMYVIIIGGQAFPLEIFPGKQVASPFFDGTVARYAPATPEVLLVAGGIGLAALIVTMGCWLLPILPVNQHAPAAAAAPSLGLGGGLATSAELGSAAEK